MLALDHINLLATRGETECHHLRVLGEVLVRGHRQHLRPLPRLQDTIQVVNYHLRETVGTLDREH